MWILLASALMAPEGTFIDQGTKWKATNTDQKALVKKLHMLKHELPKFSQDELQAWASDDHTVLNEIARKHTIPITFDPFTEGKFGTLSLLHLNLEWVTKPTKTTTKFMNSDGEAVAVDALLFSQDFKLFTSSCYPHSIVKIKTKSGDYVCMTLADKKADSFNLSKKIKRIRRRLAVPKKSSYSAVIMPQLSYDGFVDISWMNGLRCKTKQRKKYSIEKAVEYLKLRCDQEGCSVKAGVGLEFVPISSNANPLIMNKPFYFWLERPGYTCPLVEAYIDLDALNPNK